LTHYNFEFTGPSLHSTIAVTLASTLDAIGLNSQDIFLANNLNEAEFGRSSSRVPQSSLEKLWQDSVQLSNSEDLGILFAENLHPVSMHGLWVYCAASESLLEALYRLTKYYRVVSTFNRIHLSENDNEVTIHFRPSTKAVVHELIDAEVAMLVYFCRFAKGRDMSIIKTELQRPPPKVRRNFDAYFCCPIAFNANDNCVTFDKKMLKQSLPASNPAIAWATEQPLIDYLRQFDEYNFGNKIKALIIDALPNGIPTQTKIAQLMNVSSRTLKRRLASKGTSYAELMEQTQRELATQYLNDSVRSIGEISNLLGYTEPSNFTRSFKKWMKLTPIEYRERIATDNTRHN